MKLKIQLLIIFLLPLIPIVIVGILFNSGFYFNIN
jgi:hypothetical protein